MRTWPIILALALSGLEAQARNVEPGTIWLTGGPGFDLKMGSPLGGSKAHFLLLAQGEYDFTKSLGIVAGVNLGLAGTVPLRFRVGGKYRLADLGLPIAPWGQAQLSVGRLFDVLGANLTTLGVNVAIGADYFLMANLAVGAMAGFDVSTTLGERPAFYGTFEFLAVASWSFNAPEDAAPRRAAVRGGDDDEAAAVAAPPAEPAPAPEPAPAAPKKKR
jgi:hypothetical protein